MRHVILILARNLGTDNDNVENGSGYSYDRFQMAIELAPCGPECVGELFGWMVFNIVRKSFKCQWLHVNIT